MRLIDADALIERMKKDPLFPLAERYGVTGVIEAAPTVDAEPVTRGHWVTFINSGAVECSVCGRGLFGRRTDNYCYNCGAKMNGGDIET